MDIKLEGLVVLLIGVLLAFSSCVGCFPGLQRIQIPESKSKNTKYYRSVAMVSGVPVEEGPSPLGTAFAVTEDHLLTAGHVCASIQKGIDDGKLEPYLLIQVSDSKGAIYDLGFAHILDIEFTEGDYSIDICLLGFEGHGMDPLEIKSDKFLEVEDPLYIIGAPRGYFPIGRRDSQVISLEALQFGEPYQDLLFLTGDIKQGSSGSPVIWRGYVVGIVTILPSRIPNTCLAVRGRYILNFLEKNLE